MQILMHIDIGKDSAAERIVFQIIDDTVHLIHHAFLVLMLLCKLITVRLTDRTVLIRPLIPDSTLQIMDIVGFSLSDPEHLLRTGLDRSLTKRDRREFLRQIITVDHTKLLDRVSTRSVLPVRADLLALGARSVLQYIIAHINKNLVC